MATTKELQNMLEAYQTGVPQKRDMPQIGRVSGRAPSTTNASANAEASRLDAQALMDQYNSLGPGFMTQSLVNDMSDIDMTKELSENGYGTGAFGIDDKTNPFRFLQDNEDARASVQSGLSQIMHGLGKMGTTTLGQYVDTTVGTMLGLANVGILGAKSMFDGQDHGFMDYVDTFTNNWITQQVNNLSKASEEWLPNYKTQQYRQNEQENWTRNFFTANFWGDTFLKNLGFTIGSQLGVMTALSGIKVGKLSIPGFSERLTRGLSSNMAKAQVAAANGSAAAIERLNAMAKAGDLASDTFKEITNAARELRTMNAKLQLFGSTVGALSESRTEAINAATEFVDSVKMQTVNDLDEKMSNLDLMLYDKYKDDERKAGAFRPVFDENGYVVDYDILDPEILAEKEQLERVYSDEYSKRMDAIFSQATNLADMTFILNMGILSASNNMQFGKMYIGGWKNANLAKRANVRGGISTEGGLSANYRGPALSGNLGKVADFAKAAAKTGLVEGMEEVEQKIASEGEKRIAERGVELAMYNNDATDETTLERLADRFMTMFDSMKSVVADQSTWEEFAVGAMTGLLGMPGNVFKGQWNGGLYNQYKDEQEKRNLSKTLADQLNQRINSKEFQNYWKAYVRDNKYEEEAKAALEAGDRYTWHTETNKQLINNIMLFGQAGKLNDLIDIVDHFANISEDEADDVKEMISASAEAFNRVNNLDNSEILDPVRERANQVRKTIQDYKEMYEAILVQNPDASEDLVNEMLFTSLQLKNFEDRYEKLVDELRKGNETDGRVGLDDLINNMSKVSVKHKDGSITVETEGKNLERAKQKLRNALDYIVNLKDAKQEMFKEILNPAHMKSSVELLKNQLGLSAEDVKRLEDIEKLSRSRNDYFNKLLNLSKTSNEAFNKKKKTVEQIAAARASAAVAEAASRFRSVKDVRSYAEELAKTESPADVMKKLKENASNTHVKNYLDMEAVKNSVLSYIDRVEPTSEQYVGSMAKAKELLQYKMDSSNNYDEFVDDTFPDYQQTLKPGETAFADNKEAHDKAVALLKEAFTDARNNVQRVGRSNYAARRQNSVAAAPVTTQPGVDAPAAGRPVSTAAPQGISLEDAIALVMPSLVAETDDEAYEREQAVIDESEKETRGIENTLSQLNEDGKYGYYQPAIPEIDPAEANKVRTGKSTENTLVEFADAHPEFKPVFDELKRRGVFDYVDNGNLRVGDRIYFGIDPSFPVYSDPESGEIYDSISLFVQKKNGTMQMVGLLPSAKREGKYIGLKALRDDIKAGYEEFLKKEENKDKVFVFGRDENGKLDNEKSSTVWAIRKGLHKYNYTFKNGQRDMAEDNRPITDIDGYDENASIILIRKGVKHVLHGKDVRIDTAQIPSGIYYVVKNAYGDNSVVRLNVSHFNKEEMLGSSVHNRIKEAVSRFLGTSFTADDCSRLKAAINSDLFMQDLNIEIVNDDGSRYLRIATIKRGENGVRITEDKLIDGKVVKKPVWQTLGRFNVDVISDMDDKTDSVSSIVDILFSMNRPVNIVKGTSTGSFETSPEKFNEHVHDGFVKSNVASFTQKGANFYFDAYNPETHKFDKNVKAAEVRPEPAPKPIQQAGAVATGKPQNSDTLIKKHNAELVNGVELWDSGRRVRKHNGEMSFGTYNGKKVHLITGYVSGIVDDGFRHMQENINDITDYGYADVEAFVTDVLEHWTVSERITRDGKIRLSIIDKDGIQVSLELKENGDAYDIITGDIANSILFDSGEVIERRNIEAQAPAVEAEIEVLDDDLPEGFEDMMLDLDVEQAGEFTGSIDFDKEIAWLNRALPQVDKEDRIRIVRDLIESKRKGIKSYGQFKAGIITLSEKAVEGTTYHEAFHYVFNAMLSKEERARLLEDAANVYGTTETIALEELLAEEFRHWKLYGTFTQKSKLNNAIDGIVSRIVNFFRRLFNLSEYHGAYINRMFSSIDSGDYARHREFIKVPNVSNSARLYGKTFDQKHIDNAIKFLHSEAKKGVRYNIVGASRNIRYTEENGFEFYNPVHTRKSNANEAVANFKAFIAITGNNYDYLDSEIKDSLQAKGITKEDFDSSPKVLKDQLIACASVY